MCHIDTLIIYINKHSFIFNKLKEGEYNETFRTTRKKNNFSFKRKPNTIIPLE